MARTKGSRNKKTTSFLERWDQLSRKHGDPAEYLFQVMTNTVPKETHDGRTRVAAAVTLMQYRYPRLKATEISLGEGRGQLQLSWEQPKNVTPTH